MNRRALLKVIDDAERSGQKDLTLLNKGITELPGEIGRLKKLTHLDLDYNEISALPPEIGDLTNLKQLWLFGGKFRTLPPEVGRLANLEVLSLPAGHLEVLPPEVGQLTNLRSLYLFGNHLSALPTELQNLTRLQELQLQRNPDLPIPPEILGKQDDAQAILTWYFDNVATRAATRPLNEVKLLLLGQGAVGKTSLVRRLVDGTFDPNEKWTEGINIHRWARSIDGQDVRVNIWDFGGQEIMHATHQFFLTRRSVYLVVIDARQGEQEGRIHYWLRMVDSFGADSPVIVVTNKSDVRELPLNQKALMREFPSIKGFVNVSALNGDNLDKLEAAIDAQIAGLEWVGTPLAESWFHVKERLEQMRAEDVPYIHYGQYEGFCEEEGIEAAKSRETLIDYLHQLGVALNFSEKEYGLLGTFVLNPAWVTEGVYQLINARQVAEAEGRLHVRQLHDILDRAVYPGDMHTYLLQVMEAFELCFRLDSAGHQYLIPDLLPKQEPADLDREGFLTEGLGFELRYAVLPSSVFSRLLVKSQRALGLKQCWWSGMVLHNADNAALVAANYEEGGSYGGRIRIAVTGRPNTRRDFLSRLRANLHDIHTSIPGLKFEAWVPIPGHPDVAVGFEELLVYEEMGEEEILVAELKQRFRVKDLLEGVEPEAVRRRRRERGGGVNVWVDYAEGDDVHGDKVGGDKIRGDKHGIGDISDVHDVDIGG